MKTVYQRLFDLNLLIHERLEEIDTELLHYEDSERLHGGRDQLLFVALEVARILDMPDKIQDYENAIKDII